MTTSPTPRTDARLITLRDGEHFVDADFVRELEQEIAELRSKLDRQAIQLRTDETVFDNQRKEIASLREQVIEEAALACERRLPLHDEAEKQLSGDEYGAKCALDGMRREAKHCANAIRALKGD